MFSLRNEEKWVRISLYAILLLFFIVSLYAVLHYGESNLLGSIEKADNDDVKYIRSAWTYLDTGMLTYKKVNEPTVFIMPGITLILAFFAKIFGRESGIVAFRVFQVVLQILSMYLLFLISRKVFNSRVAILACTINLFSIAEYYTATLILTETIFKFLLLLLVYISIFAVEERKTVLYVLGGFVWGVACLFRPTIAAYPVVILIMWMVKRYKLTDMLKFALITSLSFGLVMSPWWIRNYSVFHQFIPLTLSSGNPFLLGTYVDYDFTKDVIAAEPGKTTTETNQNETKTGKLRLETYGKNDPLKYVLWYTIGKSQYLWDAPFYWKEIFHVTYNLAVFFHRRILITAVLGTTILYGRKKGVSSTLAILLVIGYFGLIYLPFFTCSRYAYPVMPLVGIFSACWVENFITTCRGVVMSSYKILIAKAGDDIRDLQKV